MFIVPLMVVCLRAYERNWGSGGSGFVTNRATAGLRAASNKQQREGCQGRNRGEANAPKNTGHILSVHCVSP